MHGYAAHVNRGIARTLMQTNPRDPIEEELAS